MKNIIKLLIFISFINVNAQNFNCVKTIQKNGCSIDLYNSTNNKVGDIDLSNFSWYYQTLQNIKISDDINVFNLINTCITTPTWSSLADSLNSWKVQCSVASIPSNLDTTQVDTSLINYIFQFDTTINRLDSILANIKNKPINDTTHTAILALIQDTLISKLSLLDKSDIDTSLSQVIQLNQIIDSLGKLINKEDTIHTSILNSIYSFMSRLDTTNIDTALVNYIFQFDRQNDTLSAILQSLSKSDTALGQIAQLQQIIDSLGVLSSKLQYIYELDTSDLDTNLINYIAQFERQNDSLSRIISLLYNLKDTTNQAILNAIKHNLEDSLRTSTHINNDSLNVHILNNIVDSTYYLQLDSVVKLLNAKDTIDFEFYKFCYRSKADSGVYNFNIIFNIKNTSFPVFMNLVDVDSMIEIFRADYINNVFIGTFPNYANDYIPCERWEEYLNRLDTIKDTLKALVFKPLTKNITGTQDTLYNCKGLSFRANSGASGTLVLYYEDGETDSYDLETEDLPTWDNSTFISFVGYDATGVVGKLRINAVGCSQVPDNGCAKVVPLLDCESSTPIPTCVGWASGSGVWSSISGCWNTGQ
jgi:hypothetical protein